MEIYSSFTVVFSSSSPVREFIIYLWSLKHEKIIFISDRENSFPSSREFPERRMRKICEFANRVFGSEKFLLFLSPDDLFRPFPSRTDWEKKGFSVRKGTILGVRKFLESLSNAGYERTYLVREKGEFSQRGFIIDVFPVDSEFPLRIEMDGEEVVSLHTFNPFDQTKIDELTGAEIPPAVLPETGIFLEEVPPDSSIVIDGAFHLKEDLLHQLRERGFSVLLLAEKGVRFNKISQLFERIIEPQPEEFDPLSFFRSRQNPLHSISLWIKDKLYSGMKVFISFTTRNGEERLQKFLREFRFEPFVKSPGDSSNFPSIFPVKHRFTGGFVDPVLKVALFPFESKIPVEKVLPYHGEYPEELEPGDLVVHRDYGICKYMGIVKKEINGKEQELLALEFRGRRHLFIPLNAAPLLKKYRSGSEFYGRVSLDTIDGRTWKRKREKLLRMVDEISEVLAERVARRRLLRRQPYEVDEEWLRKLSATFEYEETPHQLRTIQEIIEDLQKEFPMERVVCGDVGYGKTEIAVRAACICAMNGRQVAVLAPTTVLAEQHYGVFRERLSGFPLNIALLTRFTPPGLRKEIAEDLSSGKIDIVIGTHSILQRSISFKNLALLIIDEEHRFGVIHKEITRHFPETVDILYISATPIPRTLQMALAGLKDISRIETPPPMRLPVKTYIMEWDEGVLKMAVEEELRRGGQVFFVHTSIEELPTMAVLLKNLVPGIRLELLHGRMNGKTVERVMRKYIKREVDLLVATIIVGVGIDIPGANTMIINNAHLFGLADLYHLRGRVGRREIQGYVYLFIPSEPLPPDAIKRLRAFASAIEGGKGYYLAMKDLEIRGAGNLLGKQQWGHIYEMGFDAYLEILAETIRTKMKIPEERGFEPPEDIEIPGDYIHEPGVRLRYLARLYGARSQEEFQSVLKEMENTFGPLPENLKKFSSSHFF